MTVSEIQQCGKFVRRMEAVPGQKVASAVLDLDERHLTVEVIKISTCKYITLNIAVDHAKNRSGEISDEI